MLDVLKITLRAEFRVTRRIAGIYKHGDMLAPHATIYENGRVLMAYGAKLASMLKVGDIVCSSGKRPGTITEITRDPLHPQHLIVFKDEDDSGGRYINYYRPDVTVQIYDGEYANAIAEWVQKHGEQ